LTVCKRTLDEESELKERLGSTAHGLVDSYRIIADVKVEEGHKATIVARVSKRKIYDSYKSFFKALHDPVFYVEASDEMLKDEFLKYFIDKGVSITLQKDKAHYIILLSGKYSTVTNPLTKAKDGTQLALSMSIVSKDDSKVLMHLKNTPKKATKYGATLSEEQRKSFVNKRAFKEVHKKLDEAFHDFVLRLLDEAE
jgi:flagellar hook-associated protein FlgK